MLDLINNLTTIQGDIRNLFGCNYDFFISPMLEGRWSIQENNNTFFLSFVDKSGKVKNCVISKKDGEPLIFERDELTMIIAIECVKIAFIFSNVNRQ